MEAALFKTLGQVAGLAGISLGVVLLVFRDLIRKDIFPKLNATHAYKVLRLLIVLTWSIAFVGILAWLSTSVLSTQHADQTESGSKPAPTPPTTKPSLSDQPTDEEIKAFVENPNPEPHSLVCRKQSIGDYDTEYAAALQLLPAPTSDIHGIYIYVRSLPNGMLYAHSNFITKGYEHPTKLISNDQTLTLRDIAMNVIFDRFPSEYEKREAVAAYKSSTNFFLDDSLFSSSGRLAIAPDGATKLFVVSGNHLETLDRWREHHFATSDSR